jgi:cytochrome oxidase Cu insertion factor (SCO1/SenC/PrrC family)
MSYYPHPRDAHSISPQTGVSNSSRSRWWWYLGVPVGIAAGAVLAIWLRTSHGDALILPRRAEVDLAFVRRLDPSDTPGAKAPDGRFLLVSFGYTYCPDVCPTTLLAVHHALERLGTAAQDVVPIFVTIDPARDSAARLRTYVTYFDPRIRSVSDPAAVQMAVKAFHARATKRLMAAAGNYAMDHTAVLYVLDPGHRVIAALPETSRTLSADIVGALTASPGFPAASRAP